MCYLEQQECYGKHVGWCSGHCKLGDQFVRSKIMAMSVFKTSRPQRNECIGLDIYIAAAVCTIRLHIATSAKGHQFARILFSRREAGDGRWKCLAVWGRKGRC